MMCLRSLDLSRVDKVNNPKYTSFENIAWEVLNRPSIRNLHLQNLTKRFVCLYSHLPISSIKYFSITKG